MSWIKATLLAPLLRFGEKLRFPWLFTITAVLFVVNIFVPDVIPFADELILGFITLLLGSLKGRGKARKSASPDAGPPASGADS